jgi:hypothetical protein
LRQDSLLLPRAPAQARAAAGLRDVIISASMLLQGGGGAVHIIQ